MGMPSEKYIAAHGVNPAEILLLLRDGKAKTQEDLYSYASDKWGAQSPVSMPLRMVRGCIAALEEARLIEIHSESDESESRFITYTVATHLDELQAALGISLRDLADSTSARVRPFFGHPNALDNCPNIFVLMPFSNDLTPVYADHIVRVAKKCGLTVGRADDFFNHGSIVQDIWDAICNCRCIVADCTARNPNVFYEIGIAHTVGVPTILIAQSIDDVPFDLRHVRCIVYDFKPRGMKDFEEQLHKTLKASLPREKDA